MNATGQSYGIYIDGGAQIVDVMDNTAAFCGGGGLPMNGLVNVRAERNALFNNLETQYDCYNNLTLPVHGIAVINSTFFAVRPVDLVARICCPGFDNDMTQ